MRPELTTLHSHISALDHLAILPLISWIPNLRYLYYIVHDEYEFTKNNFEILTFSVHFRLVVYIALPVNLADFCEEKMK